MIVARIHKSNKVNSKQIANNIAMKFHEAGWNTKVKTLKYSYIVEAVRR